MQKRCEINKHTNTLTHTHTRAHRLAHDMIKPKKTTTNATQSVALIATALLVNFPPSPPSFTAGDVNLG